MRRTSSPTKQRMEQELRDRRKAYESKLPPHRLSEYLAYFCHYNNAIYMGGMSSYKKHGKGILIHDDGTTAITSYSHDSPSGHSLLFRANAIISIVYRSSRDFEMVYRQGQCILKVPYQASIPHGEGVLLDYNLRQICLLAYRRGLLHSKVVVDRVENEEVFLENKAEVLIGERHASALRFSFETPEGVDVRYDRKKIEIGYRNELGQLHGLALQLYAEATLDDNSKPFYLKGLERGFYSRGNLSNFGEIEFANGNKYVGEFQDNKEEGHGVLLAPAEMKWIYGLFAAGSLQKIIVSNNRRFTEKQFQVWGRSLREIHQQNKDRWIDEDIELFSEIAAYSLLKEAVDRPTSLVELDPKLAKKEEAFRLSRIQSEFITGSGVHSRAIIEQQLDQQAEASPLTQYQRDADHHLEEVPITDTRKNNLKESQQSMLRESRKSSRKSSRITPSLPPPPSQSGPAHESEARQVRVPLSEPPFLRLIPVMEQERKSTVQEDWQPHSQKKSLARAPQASFEGKETSAARSWPPQSEKSGAVLPEKDGRRLTNEAVLLERIKQEEIELEAIREMERKLADYRIERDSRRVTPLRNSPGRIPTASTASYLPHPTYDYDRSIHQRTFYYQDHPRPTESPARKHNESERIKSRSPKREEHSPGWYISSGFPDEPHRAAKTPLPLRSSPLKKEPPKGNFLINNYQHWKQ